ncbi:MAG: hypothetical protein AYK23_04905 [Candidatus Proteinoplasmatales archaeon SG8-5]|nr:MAG: hypothetical protein AYK23_04905 [Candidatus Proteinoplasmatales archaeon SG8-5]
MQYRVHRVDVGKDDIRDKLERFLNELKGDIIAVFPHAKPTFQPMGATAKVDSVMIVELVD